MNESQETAARRRIETDLSAIGRYDDVIDVRSEGEFAEDHIPGSVNCPVLSNVERAEVGTIYVQESKFRAKKLGAAYVAANIARHLQGHFAEKDGAYAPLVLCWRGGMRSRSLALVLEQVGWRVAVLDGGYRAYRRSVVSRLYETAPWFRAVLLDGMTGAGKTDILARLGARGWPVLDLEALAAHRGSVFGALETVAQPSQKRFEGAILAELDRLAPALAERPLLIEAESSKIGQRVLPPTLLKAMAAAPSVRVHAPLADRARYSVARYGALAEDAARFDRALSSLTPHVGRDAVSRWRGLRAAGALQTLAEELIARHYDPAYARIATRRARPVLARVDAPSLDPAGIDAAADAVERALAGASAPLRAARARGA